MFDEELLVKGADGVDESGLRLLVAGDDNLFERPTRRIPAAADRGLRLVVVHSHVRLDDGHAAPDEWKRFDAALLRLQLLQQRVLVQLTVARHR
eukprot:CAMPEP_0182851352 /NCGR_PEP_ID=MMETSP0006_2-20121128/30583_1 /TAXON_ID=97485 /ORGANISM="Prymnesium parvum, Strain Texoma1" /LENGTH=93 /DNA_ID=CAMNT_0024982021 /DNA_START=569 /DNA_END=847 /DNA_ORIENTATION=+